jgi:hypothetical protein
MDEDIPPAILDTDETEAFGGVEPFHGSMLSLCHGKNLLSKLIPR